MTDWVTIEHITFRGGALNGEQTRNVGAAGLVAVISVPIDSGAHCRYRKTGEYSQLRGSDRARALRKDLVLRLAAQLG